MINNTSKINVTDIVTIHKINDELLIQREIHDIQS